MSTSAEDRTAILIFARAPIPGEAKTRLIPLLGAFGAARLQQRLTEHALETAVRADVGRVQLWCTPSCAHAFFADCAARCPITLKTQLGSSLGERLEHASGAELQQHGAILLIGTDCPALSPLHLQAAIAALKDHDGVICPAEDGGYVLLGLARPCPEAFSDIDWGSEHVFAQTMASFTRAGRRVAVQETLWDVDVPADFERLVRLNPGWGDLVGMADGPAAQSPRHDP